MSTSFPFLEIARDFGVPYGDVIRHAEWASWTSPTDKPSFRPWSPLDYAIAYALEAEAARRAANSAPPKVIETCSPSHVTPWAEGRSVVLAPRGRRG